MIRSIIIGVLFFSSFACLSQGFTEVGEDQSLFSSSIDADYGTGVSFVDINQDGWDDLTIGDVFNKVEIYINNQGIFELQDFGLPEEDDINGITWVDIDNDGDLDLFYLVRNNPPKLFENTGDLILENITEDSGIDQNIVQDSYGASWGDYNKDGFLDLYVSNYNAQFSSQYITNHLYKNNGDNTFTDVTDEAGVGNSNKFTFVSIWLDYDKDGWVDLYVGNDRDWHENELFRNNGDGTFDAVGEETGCNINLHNMTNSVDDYDNDGDLDIYNTNSCGDNSLLENDDGIFTNTSIQRGLGGSNVSWGASWIDFDNDMDLDVYISTTSCGYQNSTANYFFVHNDDTTFTAQNIAIGNDDKVQLVNTTGDFNNDGRPDIVAINDEWIIASLYENNEINDNNYLKVSLEGTVSNRDGISSWIELYIDSITQTRYTFCGEDFLGQDSKTEHFGMAENLTADSLIVRWLSGHVDVFYDIDANQTLHIIEGSSMTPNISGSDICPDSYVELTVIFENDSILWSTGENSSTISVNEPGTYSVTVFNELGVPSNEVSFEVNYLPELELEIEYSNISCFGLNDGSANISELSFIGIDEIYWNEEMGETSMINLIPGAYNYSVIDLNGCVVNGSLEIYEPEELIGSAVHSELVCFGDCNATINLDISGGTGEYSIDGEQDFYCAGEYSFIVADQNNCETTIEVEILQPLLLELEYNITNVSCYGECDGEIELAIEGGTPGYEIDGPTDELCAGVYELMVTDLNECLINEVIEILEPNELLLNLIITNATEEALGSAEIEISGGTGPYIVEWSDGSSDTINDNLEIESYWVQVEDFYGCSEMLNFDVTTEIKEMNIADKIIYPNPTNGELYLDGLFDNPEFEVSIYDHFGRFICAPVVTNQSLDIFSLSPGSYVLFIKSESQTYAYQFIKL